MKLRICFRKWGLTEKGKRGSWIARGKHRLNKAAWKSSALGGCLGQWNCFWPELSSSYQMESNGQPRIMRHNLLLFDGSFCLCDVSQAAFYTSIGFISEKERRCYTFCLNHVHCALAVDFWKVVKLRLQLNYNLFANKFMKVNMHSLPNTKCIEKP